MIKNIVIVVGALFVAAAVLITLSLTTHHTAPGHVPNVQVKQIIPTTGKPLPAPLPAPNQSP